jgi:hypothetical protein
MLANQTHEIIPVDALKFNSHDLRKIRVNLLQDFFKDFVDKKFHKFVLYAHKLSTFDGVLILESLFYLCEENGYKLEPLIRDNKLISIKFRFVKIKPNKYRYYIEFHDSLLIILASLNKLSKTFIADKTEYHKLDNIVLLNCLLYRAHRDKQGHLSFLGDVLNYCIRDTLALALAFIINKLSTLCYDNFKFNVHNYPTVSSLAMGIYLTHYLNDNKLIPVISGKIYRDISKSFHGLHTDVFELYSKEEVHSYDFVSKYPTQMSNKEMPVGKIT